ncbi:hypothetical protein ACG873_30025 [Mesorhizobium sp. AaZ16]|uniref:hypothetical protein n=1 Tax=Mesorhizobium sp. AaZ16 TaxID=3402289 RepID=UPI00374EC370
MHQSRSSRCLGTLLAGEFISNASGTAQDADDRIIYETDTGRVWYDSNGEAIAPVARDYDFSLPVRAGQRM